MPFPCPLLFLRHRPRCRAAVPSLVAVFGGSAPLGLLLLLLAAVVAPARAQLPPTQTFYVSNLTANSVVAVAPDGTVSPYASGLNARLPDGLGFDSAGNLYTVNVNNRIGVFPPGGGTGGIFYSGSTGPALNYPTGLAIDAGNNLYVANQHADPVTGNYFILKITPGRVGSISPRAARSSGPTG